MTCTFLIISILRMNITEYKNKGDCVWFQCKKSWTTKKYNSKRNQIFIRPKTVRLICISLSKNVTAECLQRLTDVGFHVTTQTFSRLINCFVDNGLLHAEPRSDQTRVRYTNKLNKLTKERDRFLRQLSVWSVFSPK